MTAISEAIKLPIWQGLLAVLQLDADWRHTSWAGTPLLLGQLQLLCQGCTRPLVAWTSSGHLNQEQGLRSLAHFQGTGRYAGVGAAPSPNHGAKSHNMATLRLARRSTFATGITQCQQTRGTQTTKRGASV